MNIDICLFHAALHWNTKWKITSTHWITNAMHRTWSKKENNIVMSKYLKWVHKTTQMSRIVRGDISSAEESLLFSITAQQLRNNEKETQLTEQSTWLETVSLSLSLGYDLLFSFTFTRFRFVWQMLRYMTYYCTKWWQCHDKAHHHITIPSG